jgi:hypothetical protein
VAVEDAQEELVGVAIEVGVDAQRVLAGLVGAVGVIAPLRHVRVLDGEGGAGQRQALHAAGRLEPLLVLGGGERPVAVRDAGKVNVRPSACAAALLGVAEAHGG